MDEQRRNIVEKYWNWTNDLIREDLKKKSFPYSVLVENWGYDFNISSVIRNSNAFGAREVFYTGNKKFDRRGTCGTHHYNLIKHLKTHEEVKELKQKYVFIGIDNIPGSQVLNSDFEWPPNALLIFGEEGNGITKQMLDECEKVVYIQQYGSVRSVNCAVASGIIMNDYVSKFKTAV